MYVGYIKGGGGVQVRTHLSNIVQIWASLCFKLKLYPSLIGRAITGLWLCELMLIMMLATLWCLRVFGLKVLCFVAGA